MLKLGLVAPPVPYKYIGSLVPNLTLGGMGKCQKYLHNLSQTFTHIKAIKFMNMYQILSIYLIANKSYGQKTGGPSNVERLVGN
jgi:hypothetical protein